MPANEQSASLTADDNFEANQSTNRTMDTTIGTSQTSLANASLAVNTLKNYYVARFVSPFLGQSSISANTWTWSFATQQSNASARFPAFGTTSPGSISLYVWRTSTQAKVGSIIDGATANITLSTVTTERAYTTTFSGSSLSSLNTNDDVLVCEVWFRPTQALTTSYTQTFYFDGATENITTNTAGSDHATFISTPETITFYTGPPPPVDCTVTGKTLYNKTTSHA